MQAQSTHKISSNRINWLIDVTAFTLFFFVAAPQSTDIPVHEWLSLVFFATFIVHLAIHWRWIVDIGRRLLKKLPGETRFNFALDLLFYVIMVLAMVSGILISEAALPALGIHIVIDPFWASLHEISANLSLLLLAVHLALHWNWITNAFKRYVLRKQTVQ
jgi:hypothetical protein